MATTTSRISTSSVTVAIDKLHVPQNVRELDQDHVDALAGSIALQGLLVAVLVAPADEAAREMGFDYELVAGFHRHAAVTKLQHAVIDATVIDREDAANDVVQVAAARATENIARKQLNPYEEAVAVRAMLDRNYTEDGVARALGWPKARVTARMKLLELPIEAQKLVGDGVVPLACVEALRSIGAVSQDALGVVVSFISSGDDRIIDRLQSDAAWVVGQALREASSKTFAAYLTRVDPREVSELRLGKQAVAQLEEIETLQKQIDRYSYGPPPIRFGELEVDQARAAGVLLEAGTAPVIFDKSLYRELAKQALARTAEELRDRVARLEQERKSTKGSGTASDDPVGLLNREHGRAMRELAGQAHGVNTDLGWSLRNELATVDPSDLTVARFFVYGLLGSDYYEGYGSAGEKVAQLAMTGIRFVIDEFRADVTKTKKDGSRGALRIDYGDPQKPQDAIAWIWKFIDGARTAGELYGRALVVIAAEQYASRLVVPASQQRSPRRWPSHKDHAAKALAKLAGPCLPMSLKQLENAVAKAKSDYEKQKKSLEESAQQAAQAGDTDAVDLAELEEAEDLEDED